MFNKDETFLSVASARGDFDSLGELLALAINKACSDRAGNRGRRDILLYFRPFQGFALLPFRRWRDYRGHFIKDTEPTSFSAIYPTSTILVAFFSRGDISNSKKLTPHSLILSIDTSARTLTAFLGYVAFYWSPTELYPWSVPLVRTGS